MEDPSVDIKAIALETKKITAFENVEGKEIDNDHARLVNDKIQLNKKDKFLEQRFSIAHELKHSLFEEIEYYKKHRIIFKEPYLVINDKEVKEKSYVPDLKLVTRCADNPKLVKKKL